jgi:hypothetical protein
VISEVINTHVLLKISMIEQLLHGAHIHPVNVPFITTAYKKKRGRKKQNRKNNHLEKVALGKLFQLLGYLGPAAAFQHIKNRVVQEAPETNGLVGGVAPLGLGERYDRICVDKLRRAARHC